MFCQKCGTQFPDAAGFCPVCGTANPNAAPAQPPAQQFRQHPMQPPVQPPMQPPVQQQMQPRQYQQYPPTVQPVVRQANQQTAGGAGKEKVLIIVLSVICALLIAAIALIVFVWHPWDQGGTNSGGAFDPNAPASDPITNGYIIDSKITSANSTAGKIKDEFEIFRTNCDSQMAPLKGASDGAKYLVVTVKDGVWSVDTSHADGVTFGDGSKYKFNGESGTDSKNFCFNLYIQDVLRDIKNCTALLVLDRGACVGAAVVTDSIGTWESVTGNDPCGSAAALADAFAAGQTGKTRWSGGKAGLLSDGTIVGTRPKIEMAD